MFCGCLVSSGDHCFLFVPLNTAEHIRKAVRRQSKCGALAFALLSVRSENKLKHKIKNGFQFSRLHMAKLHYIPTEIN